jgi:hypothetical protein
LLPSSGPADLAGAEPAAVQHPSSEAAAPAAAAPAAAHSTDQAAALAATSACLATSAHQGHLTAASAPAPAAPPPAAAAPLAASSQQQRWLPPAPRQLQVLELVDLQGAAGPAAALVPAAIDRSAFEEPRLLGQVRAAAARPGCAIVVCSTVANCWNLLWVGPAAE